jgi:ABC-type multidrug transport system ATPase subunit/ABC-type multidrug transport system permease subunit
VKHHGVVKTLLDDVSFGVPAESLVAVIGPSGSGKSTLLRALTGYRPACEGEVRYEGHDLYAQYSEVRHHIGLVPQDDILHAPLTVRSALRYAAELRFPEGTSCADRDRRIDAVLAELHLEKYGDNKISTLSGGQRKRVSVALELLTKPSLVFLDEPTSGLDPGMDREVMRMLRGLADEGRTVVVVTHSVAELAMCDLLLVMAPGGSVAYYGPPEDALPFFGLQTWADVFHAFAQRHDYDWGGAFRASAYYEWYCAAVDADVAGVPTPDQMPTPTVVPAPVALPPQREASLPELAELAELEVFSGAVDSSVLPVISEVPVMSEVPLGTDVSLLPDGSVSSASSVRTETAVRSGRLGRMTADGKCQKQWKEQSWLSQLGTLIRRYVSVIAADRGHIMLLVALPLIMGVLSMAIPAKSGLAAAAGVGADGSPALNNDAATVLLVLAVGACLTGAANAVRELIKERVIYERERAAGLSRSAYMMSKVIVLGVITSVQTIVLSALCLFPRKLPSTGLLFHGSPIPEMMIAAVLLGIASMMLGLVVSAVVRTTEKTMPLLVLIAIVEVVFCGSLFPLFGNLGLEQLAWLSPSRWAVAAEAATINLPKIMGPPQGRTGTDPMWQHSLATWGLDVGVLVVLAAVCGALVLRLLRRHEPAVMRAA